jgi:hypothetical protein
MGRTPMFESLKLPDNTTLCKEKSAGSSNAIAHIYNLNSFFAFSYKIFRSIFLLGDSLRIASMICAPTQSAP